MRPPISFEDRILAIHFLEVSFFSSECVSALWTQVQLTCEFKG